MGSGPLPLPVEVQRTWQWEQGLASRRPRHSTERLNPGLNPKNKISAVFTESKLEC